MSDADRETETLGDALRRLAAEALAREAADAATTAAGAWLTEDAEGERWTLCAVCGWPRGTGHAPACGFRVAPVATAALWAFARGLARLGGGTTKGDGE